MTNKLTGRGRATTALGWALLGASIATGWSAPARAHGLEANRVEVVLHDDMVEAVATPPVEVLRFADANADGLLSLDEVRARREEIRRTLVAALAITDGEGTPGTIERSDVSVPRGDMLEDGRGRDFLRLTVKLRWARAPRELRLRCAFVGEHPVTVFATRAEASTPGQLTLVGEGEYGLLATPRAVAGMLRPRVAAAPRVATETRTPRVSNPSGSPTIGVLSLAALSIVITRLRSRRHSQQTTSGEGES